MSDQVVHAIIVGFDYDDAAFAGAGGPRLNGMVNDAIEWWRQFERLGVPSSKATLLTDQPPEAIKARLLALGLPLPADIAQVRTRAELMSWLSLPHWPASRMAWLISPDTRVLLAWGGHGGLGQPQGLKAVAQPEDAPVLSLPNGDRVLVDEVLGWLEHTFKWKKRELGDPPSMLAFLNACHTADLTFVGAGLDQRDLARRFQDLGAVVMAASTRDNLAHEIFVGHQHRGAMAWAVTTLLSRYECHPDGSLGLTYSELLHRVRGLLTAVDVRDEPLLFTPLIENNRPILRGFGDVSVGVRKAVAGGSIEVYPTNDKQAHVADIKNASQSIVGAVLTVGGGDDKWHQRWAQLGYVANSMYFYWAQGQTPFSGDLTLVPQSGAQGTYDLTAAPPSGAFDLRAGSPYRLASWETAANSSPKYDYVMKEAGAVVRWLAVNKVTRRGRTAYDLTFHKTAAQSGVTAASKSLALSASAGTATGVTQSVTEAQAVPFNVLNAFNGQAVCTLHNSNDSGFKGDGEEAILYSLYGDSTQFWHLVPVSPGRYRIMVDYGRWALSTLHAAADPKYQGNQEPVVLHDYTRDATQHWDIDEISPGKFRIRNAHDGRALCTLHNSKDPGFLSSQERLIVFDYTGDSTHHWTIPGFSL